MFLLTGIFLLFFGTARAQAAGDEPTAAEKREIIEALLKENFDKASPKTIYLSTVNFSTEDQKDFPRLKNKQIRFVDPEEAAASGLCLYEFGSVKKIGRFLSVSFGDCGSALVYDFQKSGGRWKSVGLTIVK